MKNITTIILTVFGFISAQNPLLIPETLSGNEFNLNLQNGNTQFLEGTATQTMGANGDILAPTLIFDAGEFIDIYVTNNIGEETTIHWHGMHVSAINDGGPHTVIMPGETWNPHFTVRDKATTMWYHPHLHQKTNEHVTKGISGFIFEAVTNLLVLFLAVLDITERPVSRTLSFCSAVLQPSIPTRFI